MTALIIRAEDQQRIAAAIAQAHANPLSLETLKAGAAPNKFDLALADRKPGFERPPSQHVEFPGGVRAAISFEQQPSGLCRHLSVSVPTPGNLPNLILVQLLCEQFGFRTSPPEAHFWLEEFEPGHKAVNVLEVVEQ